MKAAVYEQYGAADVLEVRDVPRPEITADEVLVKVYASSVTTADWRLRASDFPGGLWLAGRMFAGLFAPRNKVLGSDFAGRVVAKGENVTEFHGGDEVFGAAGNGAHAEYLVIGKDRPIVKKPRNLGYDEAAAVPFGAHTALAFLRDFAKVKPGQKVLVTGASGGVGVFAVQLARHFGAEVTGVASTANVELVRALGAHHVIDYTREDFTRSAESYDLVFDTAGVTSFLKARRILNPKGIFLPLEMGLKDMFPALISTLFGGRKIMMRISMETKAALAVLADLLESGAIRPIIDSHYPLARIADAHRRVESRHKTGAVIVSFDHAESLQLAAE